MKGFNDDDDDVLQNNEDTPVQREKNTFFKCLKISSVSSSEAGECLPCNANILHQVLILHGPEEYKGKVDDGEGKAPKSISGDDFVE